MVACVCFEGSHFLVHILSISQIHVWEVLFNCWKVGKEVDELELTPMIYFNWSERCLL